MTSAINPVSAATINSYTSSGSSVAGGWLGDALTSIKNQSNQGGIFGMLKTLGNDGSVSSTLAQGTSNANAFANISQSSLTSLSSLIAQEASQNIQKANEKKLQDALSALSATQKNIQPKNTLDPFIYFADGSSIDTNSNILTMSDGTQYDTTTGAKYVDPTSIIQMANGAYLDTKNNILTMTDGTKIDTVTGLKISVTA